MQVPSAGVPFAQVRHAAVAAAKTLARRHVHLFRFSGHVIVAVYLWIGQLRVPLILGVDQCKRPVGRAEREKLPERLVGVADHRGFSLPSERKVLVESGFVKIAVNLLGRFTRPDVNREADLKRSPTFIVGLRSRSSELHLDAAFK